MGIQSTFADTMGDDSVDQTKLMKQALAECIAVFIFVFSGCFCAASDPKEIFAIAMAFGLAIMVMAFDWGPISGGHINPAVSWAMLITRNQDAISFCAYVVAQLIGAFLGALCGRMCLGADLNEQFVGMVATNPGHEITPVQALVVEIVTTFSLVFTVFCTAVDPSPAGRSAYCGIPIGFAVVMGILASGNVSGGSMNPARSFCPAVAGAIGKHAGDGLSNLWVYFLGPLLGASIAGLTWQHAFKDRHVDE